MIADPVDRWSAVTSTEWEFGDGTTATGTAVHHRYHDPGDYTVTVSSADAVGNTTTTRRQITIAAPGTAAPIPPAPSSTPSPAPPPGAPPICSTTPTRAGV
jgi:PKD repeat protein